MDELQQLTKQKNNAYWERNQLVAALSKIFPAYLTKHPEADKDWEEDWRTIVVIELPQEVSADFIDADIHDNSSDIKDYQLTWHIHDSEVPMFDHLHYADNAEGSQREPRDGAVNFSRRWLYKWDGHTTEEKYRRLRTILPAGVKRDSSTYIQQIKSAIEKHRSKGYNEAKRIANSELERGSHTLWNYEQDGVLSKETSEALKDITSGQRKAFDEAIDEIITYHRTNIANTNPTD